MISGGEKRPLPKGERATKWRGDLKWTNNPSPPMAELPLHKGAY